MKIVLTIITLSIYSSLSANFNQQANDDSSHTFIAHLVLGDSVSYKTYLTSCLSGNEYKTMDSIWFYRDAIQLKAIYKNTLYIIDRNQLEELSKIEYKFLTIGFSSSSSFYNYIITYKGEQGLLGFGMKDSWDELIRFITEK